MCLLVGLLEWSYALDEAAKILGVHPKTIQKWDREGKIRCVRTVGGGEEYWRAG